MYMSILTYLLLIWCRSAPARAFDRNAISPGTDFMRKLRDGLVAWCVHAVYARVRA